MPELPSGLKLVINWGTRPHGRGVARHEQHHGDQRQDTQEKIPRSAPRLGKPTRRLSHGKAAGQWPGEGVWGAPMSLCGTTRTFEPWPVDGR